ncbi:unnamed protein product [Symbiodinium sp. CCMP2592]|nr:unnamed protein product [Symbiodinium sp. CCMP2592]
MPQKLQPMDEAVWFGQRLSGNPARNEAITIDYIKYNMLFIAVLHISNWQTSYEGEPKANHKEAAHSAAEKFHEDASVQNQIKKLRAEESKSEAKKRTFLRKVGGRAKKPRP